MGVTYISRDYGVNVSIVRLTTTDSTATALAANYITSQAANIAAANFAVTSNPFQWFSNDCVLLSASDGLTFCSINSTFTSLTAISLPTQFGGDQIANFTLTAAQFNTMYTTPIQVLPAQGAGTFTVIGKITMELVYGSAQFTGGGAVGFEYGNSAHLAGTLATNTEQATDFTGATANTVYLFGGISGNGSEVTTANGANTAIYISNQTAVFAAGTGAVFNGTIIYRVLPVV
jgi:hypothetical protein